MSFFFLITARKGSKRIPNKNVKFLDGKPLVQYSIEVANQFSEEICISTDDEVVIDIAKSFGIEVPFVRPDYLCTDESAAASVIHHAIEYYESLGKFYDFVVLLQPTSPLRTVDQVKKCIEVYKSNNCDMVTTITESNESPYQNIMKRDENDYLSVFENIDKTRRQDCPKTYSLTGSIYVISIKSMKKYKFLHKFEMTLGVELPKINSVDIDDEIDFLFCEYLLKNYRDKIYTN
jgi:N-acylneuraminate cytidylyltransferase